MPKVQLDLPEDVYKKLKEEAKNNFQSLRGFISNTLSKQMRGNFIDTSVIPENTTIKTTTTKSLTPEEIEEQKRQTFLKKCKQVLGEKIYKNWEPDIVREFIVLVPGSSYYEEAERIPDKGIRMAYTMPDSKQDEYITEIKKYIDHEEGG